MIRVKSWAAYKENWADLCECVVTVVIEALVGVGILCVLAIVILPALLMATVGYAPDAEGE